MEFLLVIVGMCGVAINLVAYGMLSAGKIKASEARYQIINIIGTCGILISLIGQWNLPAFVANVAWLMIAVYGLLRIYRQRSVSWK